MRYNLKNPLWKTNPQKAKDCFEKELKELIMTTEKHGFEIIEDILGEKWVYKKVV